MSNGMPGWDEWQGLDKDAQDYALYKVLSDLYYRECSRDRSCENRLEKCLVNFQASKDRDDKQQGEIDALKDRKRFDTSVSGVMGLMGGACIWILKWAVGK
jgi:hypothetical protein